MSLMLYKICFSNRSSYGPLIKCNKCIPLKKETTFLPDPEDYNSDEEINESIQYYVKINQFKNKNVKKKKEKEQQITKPVYIDDAQNEVIP